MRTMSKDRIEYYKQNYPKGTRIQLDHMGDDPLPVTDGSRGTVSFVDDTGTVFVNFDCGRCLGVCPEADSFHKLSEQEETQSSEPKMSM